jgi:formate hydrogenlyase transcriptional activator
MSDVIPITRSAKKTSAEADVALDERLAFERLLADLSSQFANVPSDRVVTEIEGALKQLIMFLGYDRSSFGEFAADGWGHILCSVAVDGVEPFSCGPMPAAFRWYLEELRSGETVVVQSLNDLPPAATDVAEFFQKSGLRSQIGIPLSVGGRIVGAIGFASFNSSREWPTDLILRLKLFGKVFVQALARRREDEKLAMAMAEIKRLNDRLEHENAYLRQSIHVRLPNGLVSRSPRFKAMMDEIALVAPTGSTVLLLGETGSGKEILAQAIHDASSRKNRPMIKVNCATLPATLIEAELFGREKGAYTGALARQPGRFEIADGSTIFLDEIGELPLDLQSKLLRVLQEGEFERLGSTHTIKVDARVIAATNRDIVRLVSEGSFREDLFYRLNVFPISVPPLRERREDIPLLTWTFVKEFCKSMGKPIDQIADESMAAMQVYPWPGNVRELRNVIERAMILTRNSILHVTLAGSGMQLRSPNLSVGKLEETQRNHIQKALERCGWRVRGPHGAAALLDINPTTLESRMKKLKISRPG